MSSARHYGAASHAASSASSVPTFPQAGTRFSSRIAIREEKFVSLTDVITTVITTDAPLEILFEGNSFDGSVVGTDVEQSAREIRLRCLRAF